MLIFRALLLSFVDVVVAVALTIIAVVDLAVVLANPALQLISPPR